MCSVINDNSLGSSIDSASADGVKLDREYTFWYHNPNDTDWTPESYHQILSIKTVEEFWLMNSHFVQKKDMIENGMFFMMIDVVYPIWEDPANINGGSVSWKVEKKYSVKYWLDSIIHLISGNFFDAQNITGISISPKKGFNIIKLWYKNEIQNPELLKYPTSFELHKIQPLYKSNCSQIERDKLKK
jgi:translation initiation factor 4E